MKPKTILIGLAIICGFYLLARATPNLLGLFFDPEYFIPEGSTVFTFRPTVMNDGYYYYFEDDLKLSKQAAEACQGFLKDSVATWCLKK